ncbi:hypothetical protein [Erwinia mallotivora]|uniref:hypothetical protein n=1 Tax=Erwinia mallotivora TaxID=69222 RepID=UPI0021C1D945|nr:hypothetical protein [Erwinia mallotivora]
MYSQTGKRKDNKSKATTVTAKKNRNSGTQGFGLVDNRTEAVAQRQRQKISNADLQVSQFIPSGGQSDNAIIQRSEWQANKYVAEKGLRRPGLNLIQLMAELYLECSPEFDSVYQQLIANLPDKQLPATDGYDPPTINDVNSALENEIAVAIEREKGEDPQWEPMPSIINKRIKKWSSEVAEKGISRRAGKSSDGNKKRKKMMNSGVDGLRLYHTKTAPINAQQQPHTQGKSVFTKKNQYDYFRTGAKNPQRKILGVEGKSNHKGDAGFVNNLDALHSVEGGETKKPLLEKKMEEGLFEIMHYKRLGQGHPGPKLGAEINSFTYNTLLSDASPLAVNKPKTPKKYLNQEHYFDELWYMTDRHQKNDKNYEAELFEHYQKIVSGARDIYNGSSGSIDNNSLRLVHASMGGESNFFDYPAVIFEPENKSKLGEIKQKIIKKWNEFSEIKMTERQSFGFLYPSISDLEKSVRIWPGQYQIEKFLLILQKVIEPLNVQANSMDNNQGGAGREVLPLLNSTLRRSMNLATAAVDRVKNPGKKVEILFNRIASNYGKGLEILNQWQHWKIDALFAEAAQIIENLNEAVLHLSSEYDQSIAQGAFEMAMLNHYRPHIEKTGYRMDSFYLTHSGQQAASSAMLFHEADVFFLKKKIAERGAVYFETLTSEAEKTKIKLIDPAYNFTCKEEVETFSGTAIDNAQIYDITNLDPAKLIRVLTKNINKKVTLYSSLSKHFQFGSDSTTLGLVIHLQKNESGKAGDKKDLDSYVPQGVVGNLNQRLDVRVPVVPSQLYHHAALLLDAQTGDGRSKDKKEGNDPQTFFMGHKFSDWHGAFTLEIAEWVASDNQCGIHSLNYFEGQAYSRQNWLNEFRGNLSDETFSVLSKANDWLDQNNLVELATLANRRLAVYEFNQQYGRWVFVAGDEAGATINIGRVPHASGGGNDHWVPLKRL